MMDLTLFDVETSINFQLILRVYQRSLFWMQEQLIISLLLPLSPSIRYIAAFNNSFPVTHCDAVLFYSTFKSLQDAPREIIKLHLTFSNCNKHSDVVKLMDCLFLIVIANELNFHTYISNKNNTPNHFSFLKFGAIYYTSMHYRLFFDKGKRCSFTSDHYNVFIISMDGTTFHVAIWMSREKS